jgi:hypothetical protein
MRLCLRLARRGRSAVLAWRIWPIALLAVGIGQAGPFALPILSSVFTLVLWYGLHRHAGSFLVPVGRALAGNTDGAFGFSSGLLAASCYLMATAWLTTTAVPTQSWQMPVAALTMAALAGGMALAALWHWWKATYAVIGLLLMLCTGLFAVWIAQSPLEPHDNLPRQLFHGVPRWLAVVALVALFDRTGRLRQLRSIVTQLLQVSGALAGVIVMAMLDIPGDVPFWAIVVLALWTAWVMSATVLPVVRDVRWFRRLRHLGWESAIPASTGLFAAVALAPAAVLSSRLDWPAWLVLFGLGAAACALKAFRPRRPAVNLSVTSNHSVASASAAG